MKHNRRRIFNYLQIRDTSLVLVTASLKLILLHISEQNFQLPPPPPPKVWVTSFLSVNGNGNLASFIMKKMEKLLLLRQNTS